MSDFGRDDMNAGRSKSEVIFLNEVVCALIGWQRCMFGCEQACGTQVFMQRKDRMLGVLIHADGQWFELRRQFMCPLGNQVYENPGNEDEQGKTGSACLFVTRQSKYVHAWVWDFAGNAISAD